MLKYKGSFEKLKSLGYKYNRFVDAYEKYLHKSGVFVLVSNKQVEYWGKHSDRLLKEIDVLK